MAQSGGPPISIPLGLQGHGAFSAKTGTVMSKSEWSTQAGGNLTKHCVGSFTWVGLSIQRLT